jgi:hypothetical protein
MVTSQNTFIIYLKTNPELHNSNTVERLMIIGLRMSASGKRADHMDNGKVEHVDKTVVEKGRGRRDNSGLLK